MCMGEEQHKKEENSTNSKVDESMNETNNQTESNLNSSHEKEESTKDTHENHEDEVSVDRIKEKEHKEEPKEEDKKENNDKNQSDDTKESEKEEVKETKPKKDHLKIIKHKINHHKEKLKKVFKKNNEQKSQSNNKAFDFYYNNYKKLLLIPIILLVLSLCLIGFQIATTGDFVKKDISLSGGKTITIYKEIEFDINQLQNTLSLNYPDYDLSVRSLKKFGKSIGLIIDGSVNMDQELILSSLSKTIGNINKDEYSVTEMGSSLGKTFFSETLKAIYISFLFMGVVIFWYFGQNLKFKIASTLLTLFSAYLLFAGSASLLKDIIAYIIGLGLLIFYLKNSVPSFMVILNVFSDMIVTLSVFNLLGMKLSTAGIASFLMIVGYSVDTNILLSTKLIKRKEDQFINRLKSAMTTGLTMTFTTLAAIIVALIFTGSTVIKQIMIILLIGLIVDTIYTWLQNAAILRIVFDKQRTDE
jgi:preprotein translocase subunit SecF